MGTSTSQHTNTAHVGSIGYRLAGQELLPRIREFLLESVSIYPGIDDWWDGQVLDGIRSGERICRVALDGERLAAVSIAKRSHKSAKLCTLRVRQPYQSLGVGQNLLRETFSDLLQTGCRSIHYTISEEIRSQCGGFFESYGFKTKSWKCGRYVKGMDELLCAANAPTIAKSLRDGLRYQKSDDVLVISIKPENARLIESGCKHVEFRRRFSERLISTRAMFYVSSPVKAFRFAATISSLIKSTPDVLWRQFKHLGGTTRSAYNQYFSDTSSGYALLLSDVESLPTPISLRDPSLQTIGFRPPQSYGITNCRLLHQVANTLVQ